MFRLNVTQICECYSFILFVVKFILFVVNGPAHLEDDDQSCLPDHSRLPEYDYFQYQQTPNERSDPDGWQLRFQAKKIHGNERLVLSAFADKLIGKPMLPG